MALDGRTLGLALSGGGYRATLFGLGSLWRLNDAGLLGKLDRITSVSGGSILLGVLAQHWRELQFEDGRAVNFAPVIADPVRTFCGKSIDVGVTVLGALTPFKNGRGLPCGTLRQGTVRRYPTQGLTGRSQRESQIHVLRHQPANWPQLPVPTRHDRRLPARHLDRDRQNPARCRRRCLQCLPAVFSPTSSTPIRPPGAMGGSAELESVARSDRAGGRRRLRQHGAAILVGRADSSWSASRRALRDRGRARRGQYPANGPHPRHPDRSDPRAAQALADFRIRSGTPARRILGNRNPDQRLRRNPRMTEDPKSAKRWNTFRPG